ncbi:MAG TPA: GtrA family protein [Candidatus Paceibacterota bacterium]
MVQALLNSKRWGEYARFAVTGVANTAIDFAAFNGLLLLSGGTVGRPAYVVFKSVSFCAAVANSYVMNSRWVFKRAAAKKARREGVTFFAASGIGFLLNIAASVGVFSLVKWLVPSLGDAWGANIGAVAGVIATNTWNFLSYKFFVFKADARTGETAPKDSFDASAL